MLKQTRGLLIMALLMIPIVGSSLIASEIASDASTPESISAIRQMLRSMDHIHTFQATVTVTNARRGRTTTLNYELYSDQTGRAAAKVTAPHKIAYVKNKKGFYVIQNGEAKRQPPQLEFPFDIPNAFFSKLAIKDVTDNYKFVTAALNSDTMTIELIPIDTGGKSIASAMENDPVTMLRFTLNLPQYTLSKLEIFKNNSIKTNDTISLEYDLIDTKKVIEKGFFRNKYANTEELAPVLIRSTSEIKKPGQTAPLLEVKTTRYAHVKINEKIDDARFNEEDY